MAQFKLGRIKFVYQGAWQAGYSYVVDDVVTNGGKTYICVIANTSSAAFATDLAGGVGVTKWNLIADGQSWKGTWTNSTLYNAGDLAQYGGIVYQCTVSNTSVASTLTITATGLTTNGSGTATLTYATQSGGAPFVVGQTITLSGFTPTTTTGTASTVNTTFTVLTCTNSAVTFALTGTYTASTPYGTVAGTGYLESQINDWTPFASNLNWIAGGWQTSTKYKVDDLIYYGGVTYVCNTAHVSASTTTLGLEANSSYWSTFNAGLNYLGAWSGSSTRYKLNDIVKYGPDLWICTIPHTSTGSSINTTNFSIFVNGLEFLNSWNNAINYAVGDVVTYGGYTYTATQDNIGQVPSTAASYWQVFTTGLVYVGAWVSSTSYKIGSVVTLGGFTYVATADNSASQPPSSNWSQLNPGIRWAQPATTTITNQGGTNVIGTGSGATFDITLTGTTYSATVHPGSAGNGYAQNNTIKILGTSLNGLSPANDLLLTVSAVNSGAITSVTVTSGFAVTWRTGTTYLVGDAVYYSNSSYICVSSHVGLSGTNDPISDTTASYWNVLAQGANGGVLTNTGDMVYFGANGATRLPIGTDGQVLRVNNNVPSWQYYGLLQNVVYVASTGVDVTGNSQGQSIDKPWATVAFACKQIEDGYLNTYSGLALKINKQFMMKEVGYWIQTQYAFNITGTSISGNTFTVGGSSTTSQTTTANMYYGMPITFTTAITTQITPGTVYYVNTIPSSTTFTISASYKSGTTLPITGSSSTTGTANFNYTIPKAERDAGTLIDAVIFDLTHGGNLYCVTATQSFFATLTSFITTNATQEINTWIASLNYLNNTLFASVLTNSAPAYNYQTIQGIPTANQAIQNTTEVSTSIIESAGLTTAQGLLNILINALTAGTYSNIPQLQRPHTSIYLKTGTFNEYGPIIIPQDTAVIGDELRSTIVQASAANSYLINDVTRTASALRRVQNLLPAIASNIPVTTTTGNTASQLYLNNSTPSYSTATQSVVTNSALINNILTNGFSYSSVFGSPNTTTVAGMTLATAQYGTLNVATGGVFTIGTAVTSGIFYAGQSITVTGTLTSGNGATWTGYTSGNTYYVIGTPTTTSFTLSATLSGSAVTTTAGTITGLSFTLNVSVPNIGSPTLTQPTGFAAGSLTNTAYSITGLGVSGYTGNVTGATTGYAAGVTAIANNAAFIQTEVAAYMYTNYNSVWAAMGATYQGRTLRDIGCLLQSLQYDMTYGGNSQSQVDGLSYYSLGTSSIVSTYQASTNALLVRVQTIINNIVTGTAITKTTGNTATQNTASTGSANAGTYAQALVGTVITVFASGTNSNTNSQSEGSITGSTVVLPYYGWASQALQNAFTSIQAQKSYIQTQIQTLVATQYPNNISNLALTYRDAGTIVDALSYDMVLGSNYFSLVSGRAFYRYVTSAQALVGLTELAPTQASVQYIGYYVGALASSSSQLPTLTSDFGNPAAVNLVANNTAIIQNMFANGLTISPGVQNNTNYVSSNGIIGTLQEPAFTLTAVANYNTYYLVGYGNGVTQIQNNYQFIKDEIVAYLTGYLGGATWASYSPAYQAETVRDLLSVLDALQYDMTYGCNTQSLIVGSSYYSLNTPLITSAYLPGTLAALTRLQAIINNIVTTAAVTPSSGNNTSQSTSGSAGTSAAGAFAVARLQDIINWLNNGLATTTTGVGSATFSGTTMTVSSVSSGTFALGQCVTGTTLTTIATAVNGSTGAVTLASVTGLASGMPITFSTVYGSGNQSAFGNLTTTTYTINTVVGSTVTLYNFGTTTAPNLTTATGQLTVTAGVAPGTYIISIGSTNGGTGAYTVSVSQTLAAATTVTGTFAITPVVSGAYNFATPANQLSFNAIQAQAPLIANDAQGWVTRFFQNEGPSLTLTNRDAGYVVNALSYDVLFNSNFYSIITGRSYNRLIPSDVRLQTLYADATYGSIGFIGQRIKVLAATGSVVQTQTTIDDMLAQLYGQPTTNCVFNGTVNGTQLTVNSITTGAIVPGMPLTGIGVANGTSTVSGATTSITGTYISSTSGVFSLATPLISPLVVGQQVTISGTFSAGSITSPSYVSGTTYYVIGTPTTSSFQLSATQGGVAITTTTGGSSGSPITGITITASPTTWLLNYSQSVSSTTTSVQNVIPTTNYLTLGTTAGMVPGLSISLTGTAISNLTAGTYYIKQVLNTTQLTVSATYNGAVFAITPTNTLTNVTITSTAGTFACTTVGVALTVGQPVTISGTNTGNGGIVGYSTPTTYYIVLTNGSTSFTLSATIGGSAIVTSGTTTTGWTFAVGATGSMIATVYGIYNGLALTTNLTGTSTNIPVTAVTTGTNAITVSSDAGVYINMPIVFSGLPNQITTTAVGVVSTNTITLAASTSSLGIVAGQQVYFTGLATPGSGTVGSIAFNQIYYVINPTGSTIQISKTAGGSAVALYNSPTLSTVAITGTAGQFTCASYSTLYVGQAITINGTLSAGTINGSATVTAQTFYIILTNGSTSFTLSATLGGTAIASTSSGGTITGTTFGVNSQMSVFVNAAGGLVNGNTYWVNTVSTGTYPAAGTSITVTSSYKSGTAFTITNSLIGLTATASIGVATTQGYAPKIVNGLSQPWGNITGAYQSYPGYNNTLSTITGGELLRLNKSMLAGEMLNWTQTNYSSTATGTASNGTITTSTPHNLLVNDPVQFGLTGTIFDTNLTSSTVYWVLSTPSNTTFTVSSVQPGNGTQTTQLLIGGSGSMGVNYYIPTATYTQNNNYFVDALVYDIGLTGNYKSTRYTQLYLTQVNGSLYTDIFRCRNGTGIRNMTMNGLQGTLTLPNSLGTKRPTGGSYVSFDPGFGPNDSSAWIFNRSPYTQNMTNFGNGCVGMKLDAALHNGGNKSMVSNDFTQVLSDGIGVWCTGHGSITEAVSVFCYYGYAGYMSELGGRIRATNGNSSYGTYGVIAEGTDSYEVAGISAINNRGNPAYITNVVTDQTNYIFRLEYENAGINYTNYVPTISGAGYNATALGDEFRDAAVFETRLVDLNNGQGVGGSNYLTISNTAQSGGVGYITIANSDTQLSSAYIGMRVFLTGGTGVGQYATALNYTSGSKIINVYRQNFVPLTITVNSTSVFTVASTNTMYANQPIYLGSNIGGLTGLTTVYYVVGSSLSNNGTTFSLSTSSGGSAATLTATSSTPAVMNSSTIIGTTLTVGTLASGVIYPGMLLSGTGVATGTYITANISGSSSGSTWTVNITQNLSTTNITGTISIQVYEAGWDHSVPGYTTVNALDATTTYTIEPLITFSSPGYTSTSTTIATGQYGAVTYANGNFVTTTSTGSATQYSTNGSTWNVGGALPSSTTWTNLVYGGGQKATGTAIIGGLGGAGCVLQPIIGTGSTAGQVIGITVVNGGNNYTTPPTIVITDSTGSGATATAEVLSGAVTNVYMNITGSLYTNPTVTAITSELSSITANTWGINYYTNPTVTITPPYAATQWVSAGAATANSYYYYVDTTVSPNVTNYYQANATGTFSAIAPTFTNQYYGKSSPTGTGIGISATYGVKLTYVGSLPIVTANLTTNGVSSYTVTQGGFGYTSTPTVTVTDPYGAFLAISSSANSTAYNTGASYISSQIVVASSISTTITLAYAVSLPQNAPITFATSFGTGPGVTAGTTYYVAATTSSSTTLTIASTINGSAITIGTTTGLSVVGTVAASTNLTAAWLSGPATGLTTLKSLAYGNNYYIAVGGSGSAAAVSLYNTTSLSGASWVNQSSSITANSSGYTAVAYGAGLFCAIGGTISSFMQANPTVWTAGGTLTSKTWVSLAYGNGRFVALASDGTLQYTQNWQSSLWTGTTSTNNTWVTVNNNPLFKSGLTTWKSISYAEGQFVAVATSSQAIATSWDGLNWYYTSAGLPSSSNWTAVAFGNPQNATLGAVPTWVAVSNTSGTVAALIQTGATPLGRVKITSNAITEIRMIEPGSGFPRGNVTATTGGSTNTITVDSTVNLAANMPVVFNGTSTGGVVAGKYYYVVSGTITGTTFQISLTAGSTAIPLTTATVTGMTYFASPVVTITDPNHVNSAPVTPRIGNGALGNPSFTNRGVGDTTATAIVSGDGSSDIYQTGNYINVSGLYSIPAAGSNIQFATITGNSQWYKLVQVTNQLGIPGNYTATFQINPSMSVLLAPPNGTQITTRLLYSNTRMTGHDFLYIGTGGFTATNYPNVDPSRAVIANQTFSTGGGRVFFTSTDQDGNFNVGNLFGVQQSTGTASLNASAFNLSGLQSLTLGSVNLGVGSATITQFSTDPYFTANSDAIVPTQKAIKAYITSQIGGGQSSLNVNTITSGVVYIAGNTISTTTGVQLYVSSKMLFTGGIDGAPVALSFFGQR